MVVPEIIDAEFEVVRGPDSDVATPKVSMFVEDVTAVSQLLGLVGGMALLAYLFR